MNRVSVTLFFLYLQPTYPLPTLQFMRPELKTNSEQILFALAYLEHLSKQDPQLKRAIELLPILNRFENVWDEILRLKSSLELAIKIPEYNFSQILTKEQYKDLTVRAINDIQTRYLNVSNNKLNESDKIFIVNGLRDFYQKTEYSIIPFYNQYRATKHDRIAYTGLFIFYLFSRVIQYFFLVQERKTASDDKKVEITRKIDSIKAVIEIEEAEMEMGYAEMMKKRGNIPAEVFERVKSILMLSPEKQAELDANQMFSGLDLATISDGGQNLDNKALESHYIKIIFKQVQKSLPSLTLHRKYILTGYIAVNFNIIDETEYHKREYSSYKSLTQFLRDRVKGIVSKG